MSFFDTSFDPNNHSRALFVVADSWWWFIALSIPFTIVVVFVAWYTAGWSTKQVDQRRKSEVSDLEKVLSYEMTMHEHKPSTGEVAP